MQNKILEELLGPGTPAEELLNRTQAIAGPIGATAIAMQNQLEKAELRADTDPLTGLKNRYAMERELERIIANPGDNPDRYIVMFMDLNNFKKVNDGFGHAAGNSVLKNVGKRLELRKTDIVGRIGGDEFLVIVDSENVAPDRRTDGRIYAQPRRKSNNRADAIKGLSDHVKELVIQGVQDASSEYRIQGREFPEVSASIGVVELNGYQSAAAIMNAADDLMYIEKNASRSSR